MWGSIDVSNPLHNTLPIKTDHCPLFFIVPQHFQDLVSLASTHITTSLASS